MNISSNLVNAGSDGIFDAQGQGQLERLQSLHQSDVVEYNSFAKLFDLVGHDSVPHNPCYKSTAILDKTLVTFQQIVAVLESAIKVPHNLIESCEIVAVFNRILDTEKLTLLAGLLVRALNFFEAFFE